MNKFLLALACLTLTIKAGISVTCFVCLPPVVGDLNSRNLAVLWRANISRTWDNKLEKDFGECPYYSYEERFQFSCTDVNFNACVRVTNGLWIARTCGNLPNHMNVENCKTTDGVTICYSQQSFGNGAAVTVPTFKILVITAFPFLLTHFILDAK